MLNMWTLGGLSVRELVWRTWSDSWRDAVFGQAGRMAFYHFLALFPSLLIFLSLAEHLPVLGPELKLELIGVGKEFLPAQASSLVEQIAGELNRHVPAGLHFLSAFAGTVWAALNGTWVLVYGLNTAYEVEEGRPWWKLAITVVGLAASLATLAFLALILLFSAGQVEARIFHHPLSFYPAAAALRVLEWLIVLALLMFSFAIVYRFAPNLREHEWKWSTPGAVCALLLWVAATVSVRFYFQRVNDYTRTYGHLNSAVMLLLWLYLTNGAVLIGGEMNSEIEKAGARDSGSNRSGS